MSAPDWAYIGYFRYEDNEILGLYHLNTVIECPYCYALVREAKQLDHISTAHPERVES